MAEEEEAKENVAGGSVSDQKSMGDVTQMALDAMSKEAKYERMAEKEELDREVMMELEDRKKNRINESG